MRRLIRRRMLPPKEVVDDQVDQLDADERRDDPSETVDPQVAATYDADQASRLTAA
jgi:hypothetical protein